MWVTWTVGGISETVPVEVVWPRPAPICAAGPRSRAAPYIYPARRVIAGPAKTFSAMAASMNPSGAMTETSPDATCSSVMMPLTPPKWSTWEWV